MQNIVVAGIDISKRFSDMCILSPDNDIFAEVRIFHDLTSMSLAVEQLNAAQDVFGSPPVVVMESTSHYHLLLLRFLQSAGFQVVLVNPIQSGALRNINIRKIKNDKVDAHKLALLYRMKVLRPSQVPEHDLRGLRTLCRQHSELKCEITRYKNRLTSQLDQCFPGYDKAFSDVGGMASLEILQHCPTPQLLLQASPEELDSWILSACPGKKKFAAKKLPLLRSIAQDAVKLAVSSPADAVVIRSFVDILKLLSSSVLRIDAEIRALIAQNDYIHNAVTLLQTIPGVGPYLAPAILGEIGNFQAFQKPKQLAAYFGLDPSEKRSGTFNSSKNAISKRGSSLARASLNMVACNSIFAKSGRSPLNPVLADYYCKKLETKPHKVALCAVMHKLVIIIFAVLRDQKPFELRSPEDHAKRLGVLPAA